MTSSARASPLGTKMPWRRARSPGWAAFNLKQQQDQCLIEAGNDPYPSISDTGNSFRHYQNVLNNDIPVKPFSSVLVPYVNFPTLTTNEDLEKPLHVRNSVANRSNKIIEERNMENKVFNAYEKLKQLHSWADKSLFEDIMAHVKNDIDHSSILLEGMVSSENFDENEKTNIAHMNSNTEETLLDGISLPADKGRFSAETTALEELSCVPKVCLNNESKELVEDHAASGKILPAGDGHMNLNFGNLSFVPVEPEWEEDDIYLIHRKDAIRMMRSASRHSKAASDAYHKGDHLSAQQFSVTAQEEWKAVERLNTEAAKEILSIRNVENDAWKLDLHGLHVVEAVRALQEHLQMIESLVPLNRPGNAKAGFVSSASLESMSHMDMGKLDKQEASSRHRPASLQVVTGRGNHSRGQAALPTAIRSFLTENRYHYDEARPGVITVLPKFRYH